MGKAVQAVVEVEHEYLSPVQVAEMLPGITVNTLAIWRYYRRGPSFRKVGRNVLYARDEVLRFVEETTRECAPQVAQLRRRR